MPNEYGEFVGVDNLHIAKVTKDDATAYETDAPEYLAPAAEVAGEPEVNSTPTYYDNKPKKIYVTEGTTPLTITVSGVPAKLAAYLTGKYYDETTGRVLDSGKPNPPDMAFGFRFDKGEDGYRYYWYLKGKFTLGAEEAATKSGDVDIRTFQLTYTALTTEHEWTVDGKSQSMKRVYGDTSETVFDASSWFDQVQTPSTTSAPSALALSTIVPNDDATGIAVGANIVLTFNNKISSENIMVISESGETITASKTWDATGKILTINPSSDLSSSTLYLVALAGVKDIYGQLLTETAKNFTTA